jgi:predicted nucleotide-binding protein
MGEHRTTIGQINGERPNIATGAHSHAGDVIHQGVTDQPRSAERRERRDTAGDADKSRNVFVIHGRDEEAREAVFDFLRALGLRPLEWEHLVHAQGIGAPSLATVVTNASHHAQAVLALLTPDDIVALHPTLHGPHDAIDEVALGCQARPNVFLELGMALAILPERTIIVEAGAMRRPADLAGLNYIRVTRDAGWCNKVAERLRTAGCPVDRMGTDWQRAGQFIHLAAHDRRPPSADSIGLAATRK